MQITINELEAGPTLVSIQGNLDIAGSQEADATLSTLNKGREGGLRKVILDLSGVGLVASLGIRSLVMAAKGVAQRGGKTVAFGANDDVSKVLKRTGIDAMIPLLADQESAVSKLTEE